MNLSKQTKGVLTLILLAFGFGAIAISARYMSFYFTLFQQLYLSAGLGFLISLIFFNKKTINRLKNIRRKDWLIMIGRVVVGYLVAAPLYRQSLVLTKISNVTFIQSIPFAAIFGWLIFKEKFNFKKFLLILVAYIGVVIIAVRDFSSILSFGQGELFSLISAGFFSFSYLMRKWQSNFLDDKEITQILLLVGTIMLYLTSALIGEKFPLINWQTNLFWAVFFTGFFNAFNIFLINYGFKNVKAVLAANILTLEAIFAVILAFIFYKELPNLKELSGGILIIVSVIQMNRLK